MMERIDSVLTARGFESEAELLAILRQVPQETTAQREAFWRWATRRGTKDELLLLADVEGTVSR